MAAYDEAVKFLKSLHPDGKFTSMKPLKERKAELEKSREAQQAQEKYYYDYQNDLHVICSNVDSILGEGKAQKRENEQSRS